MNSDDLDEVDFEVESQDPVSAERAAYNTVTDLVTGPNIRKKDNVFQAIFILISVVLFAIIGGFATLFAGDPKLPFWAGMLMGGVAGMVIGVFASGIYLMIYRGLRHMKGEHD